MEHVSQRLHQIPDAIHTCVGSALVVLFLTIVVFSGAPPAARYQFAGGSPMHCPTVIDLEKFIDLR